MFLLMFMVPPFDVLNILIGHIVFYRFVIGGAYYEDRFHSRLHSQFTYFVSIYSQSFFHQFKGFFGTNIETSSNWRVSSVGKALRRYRKGHGFKSRTGLYAFFQVLFSLLLKQCSSLRSSLSFQIDERWRNQSCGNCTDNPANQFLTTFIVNFFQALRVFQVQAARPAVRLKKHT